MSLLKAFLNYFNATPQFSECERIQLLETIKIENIELRTIKWN